MVGDQRWDPDTEIDNKPIRDFLGGNSGHFVSRACHILGLPFTNRSVFDGVFVFASFKNSLNEDPGK